MATPLHSRSYLRYVIAPFRERKTIAVLLTFIVYWAVPGLLVLFSGACTADLFPPTNLYLADFVHAMFTAVALFLLILVLRFASSVDAILSEMKSAMYLEKIGDEGFNSNLRLYQSIPFSVPAILFCVAIGVWVAELFIGRVFDADFAQWWGHYTYGIAGFYYAIIIGPLSFLAAQYFILIFCIFLFFVRIVLPVIKIRPFHPDGRSGLSVFERFLFYMYLQTLVTGLGVLLVFWSNYLGIVNSWVIWIVAAFAIISLPLASVVPTVALVLRVMQEKQIYCEKVLKDQFPEAPEVTDRPSGERIVSYFDVRDSLNKIIVSPFSGVRVAILAFLNATQLIASAYAIVPQLI